MSGSAAAAGQPQSQLLRAAGNVAVMPLMQACWEVASVEAATLVPARLPASRSPIFRLQQPACCKERQPYAHCTCLRNGHAASAETSAWPASLPLAFAAALMLQVGCQFAVRMAPGT